MEREGIDRRVDEATRSGDQRRQELVEDVAERAAAPARASSRPTSPGKVQALQEYEFMDDAARERFEELMDQLREQLMQSYFNQLSEGMQNMTPERMAQMKDMLNELNQMLEQRERGEEPDFDGFMERHGDFFPGNPQNLDELLEQMAQSMAQMQQLMNSMTPEQRAQLQGLAESLLEDMDLRWQVDQLSRNLQQAFPNLPWQRSQRFSGDDPLQFGQMPALLDTLGDLDDAREPACARPRSPASSPRSTSTAPASCSATTPRSRSTACASSRRCSRRPGSSSSAKAGSSSRRVRDPRHRPARRSPTLPQAAEGPRRASRASSAPASGNEHAHDHKPYEFGDPFHLNVQETVKNAIWRGGCGHAGAADPRRLRGRAHRACSRARPPC